MYIQIQSIISFCTCWAYSLSASITVYAQYNVPCLSKELYVAGLAVGVVAVLLEGALVKQLEAEGTREVFRMPLLAHRGDAPACVVERNTPLRLTYAATPHIVH